MASDAVFKKVLKKNKIGYLAFDANLVLSDFDIAFCRYFWDTGLERHRSDLWQIFPELVGSEASIYAILNGKRRTFDLEFLNKFDKDGRLRYFRLDFSRLSGIEGSAGLLCLVDDVTATAAIQQRERQARYASKLEQAQLLSQDLSLSDALLGNSGKVQEIRAFIEQVAQYKTTVLFQGESGTGKSLAARLVHQKSAFAEGPFIAVNCAAIPETLIESELFGYEKGAFTNALDSKQGLLEAADGGTLFLDEIGEMPLAVQAKLLTFIETKKFRRIGSTADSSVEVRLITATNKDLRNAVAKNEFRQDLFFRVNVVNAVLPPLRELGEDVILLAEHFLHVLKLDLKKPVAGLTSEAKEKLRNYHWPGNARELRNAMERAIIFTPTQLVGSMELILQGTAPETLTTEASTVIRLPAGGLSLEKMEKQLLCEAMQQTGGNQRRAARLLHLSLDTLRYRLKKFNISASRYR